MLIKRLRESKNKEERWQIKLDTISLISTLATNYAVNLQSYSSSVINNKEEYWKKSMIECIHQAGREVGYQHETDKINVEAAKALLEVISDMEKVEISGSADLTLNPVATDLSSTLEQAVLPEEEQKSMFGRTPDKADE